MFVMNFVDKNGTAINCYCENLSKAKQVEILSESVNYEIQLHLLFATHTAQKYNVT